MKHWTLGWTAQSLATQDLAKNPRPQQDMVAEFSTDTRTLKAGSVFVPLVGEQFDGHDYVDVALKSGCAGVVWGRQEIPERLLDSGVAVFAVSDTTLAYQALGLAHRKACGARCVGITGSVGKTTTKEFLAHLLGGALQVHKSSKNFNNDIGVPLTLLATQPEHDVVIVEMGMRGAGEIARLVRAAEPEVGLVTAIGSSHLELLGTRENIARAKGELVQGLPSNGRAVLPAEDDFFELLRELAVAPVLSYGVTRADIAPDTVLSSGPEGTAFVFQGREYHLAPAGRHHLHDLLGALAAGVALGVETEVMLERLATLGHPEGRAQWLEFGGARVYLDAYNSAPESLRAALSVVADCPGRRLAVLGDMLELGEHGRSAHEEVGQQLSGYGIDLALCVGALSCHTVEFAERHGVEAVWFSSKELLAERLQRELRAGVTVLMKASRGMALETVLTLMKEKSVTS